MNEHYKTHLDKSIHECKGFAPRQRQNEQSLGTVPSKPVFNHDASLDMGAHPFNNAVHPRTVFDVNGFTAGGDYLDALTDGSVSPNHDEDSVQFIQSLIPGRHLGDVDGFGVQLSTTPLNSDTSIQNVAPPCSVDLSDLPSPSVRGNDQECGCIACLEERSRWRYEKGRTEHPFVITCPVPDCNCRVPDCNKIFFLNHEYQEFCSHNFDRQFKQGAEKYACNAPDCGHILKRWPDLLRHSRTYCIRGPQFPCNEFGCSRGGDNGFHRKEKLKDHQRKVHQGNVAPKRPGQPMRPLKAKVQK